MSDETKETELKECPFCGGEAEFKTVRFEKYGTEQFCVDCRNCPSRVYAQPTKAAAAQFWNQRQPAAAGEKDLHHALRLMFEGTDEDRLMYLERMARRYDSLKSLAEKYPRYNSPISRGKFLNETDRENVELRHIFDCAIRVEFCSPDFLDRDVEGDGKWMFMRDGDADYIKGFDSVLEAFRAMNEMPRQTEQALDATGKER